MDNFLIPITKEKNQNDEILVNGYTRKIIITNNNLGIYS